MTERYKEILPSIETWLETQRESYINDLISLVNIESVAVSQVGEYQFGIGCAQALDKMLELAKSYELETENDDYYCGSAIYRGATDHEMAMVGHLDVVPAGNGWTYEPYNATVRDGQIIGRGTTDDKGAVVAALYALKCLSDLGIELKHSVRLLMGCHEESGMTDMPYFLEKHRGGLPKLFLVCDCPFPIHFGEKGILELEFDVDISGGNLIDFHGGLVSNSVPAQAYAVISGKSLEDVKKALRDAPVSEVITDGLNVKIITSGKGGHAAFPQNDSENAIAKLAAILATSGLLKTPAKEAVTSLAELLQDYYGSGFNIAFEDDVSGKTTAVGGIIRLEDGRLYQNVNVRYSVTQNQEQLLRNITEACKKHGFNVKKLLNNPPMYIPLDSMNGLPRRLTDFSNELLGLGNLKPVVLPGGTHARKLPRAFGYGPNLGPELEFKKKRFGSPHGPDESVLIDDMIKAIRIYAATWIWLDEQL